jgi:hypothetical protein
VEEVVVYEGDPDIREETLLIKEKSKTSLILRLTIVIRNLGRIASLGLQLLSIRLESSLQCLVLKVLSAILSLGEVVTFIAHHLNSKKH